MAAGALALSSIPHALFAQEAAGIYEVARSCAAVVTYISRVGNLGRNIGLPIYVMLPQVRADFELDLNTAAIVLGASSRGVLFDQKTGIGLFEDRVTACSSVSPSADCDWAEISEHAKVLASSLVSACHADYSGTN